MQFSIYHSFYLNEANAMILLLSFLIFPTLASPFSPGPIIRIENGLIEGLTVQNIYNRSFYAFLDVPYAVPPVGDLRLKPPLPARNWDGVLQATSNKKTCWEVALPHMNKTGDKPDEDEDCLYLNVYTPKIRNEEDLLPVVIYIYGGNFCNNHGWFEKLDPQLLVDKGVIAVLFNYRSGPLGFLSTADGVIPENLGLKDQRLVFRWVQRNIIYFGGDASKVTVMGYSSGAMSIGFHLLTTKSEGLFRSVILHSGSVLIPSSVRKHAKYYAYELGKQLSPDFTDKNSSMDLLNLLNNSSASAICNAKLNFHPDTTLIGKQFLGLWSPVIEHESNEDPIVTGPMYEDLLNGKFLKVPTLMGITSEEILFYVIVNNISQWASHIHTPELLVQEDSPVKKDHRLEYGQKLQTIYSNVSFQENIPAFYRFLSDVEFRMPVIAHADIQSRYNDTYFYQFSYYGKKNVNKGFEHPVNIPGLGNVGHTEDKNYVLLTGPDRWNQSVYPEQDLIIQDRMVRLWTNFIKYMNPTPEQDPLLQNVIWPKVKSEKHNFTYLDIDVNFTIIHDYPREFRKIKPLQDQYFEHPIKHF